jgi:hypothetical protein
MKVKFIFIYLFFDCISENEDELSVENQNATIVSSLDQRGNSTFNVALVDSIQNKMQGIISEFPTIEKLSMLASSELIALEKTMNMFSRSMRAICNPQVAPKTIALPRAGTNIGTVQAHVTMTRLGHGKPWKGKEAVIAHENPSCTHKQCLQEVFFFILYKIYLCILVI